jgi:capsular polysaccharide biosynthesis protein
MSIIQFLKLLKKNIIILLLVPIILASMVFYSTRNEVKIYSSSATIYTGVGSGLSVESQGVNRLDYFGSKLEFDNILNIFKARETKKDV